MYDVNHYTVIFCRIKMQKDKPASHCRFHENPSLCSPYFCKSEGYDYASLYPDLSSPVQFSPYSLGSVDYSYPSSYLFTDQHEDLKEQKSWCLSRLRETTKEAEALRQENINLQIANSELNKQYNNLLMVQWITISKLRDCLAKESYVVCNHFWYSGCHFDTIE